MKKIFYTILFAVGLLTGGLFMACSDDIDPIVSELDFPRLMTPLELEYTLMNQVNVILEWNGVKGAEGYILEFAEDSLEFNEIVKTVEVLPEEIPATVALAGETQYSVRVKATSSTKDESKYASIAFKTLPENILLPMLEQDCNPTSLTIRFPAGSEVTDLVATPGNITHTITPQEIADGAATIDGLIGNTEYVVTLKNNGKTRGYVTATTLEDFDNNGAIVVETSEELLAALQTAGAGTVIAVKPGEYTVDATITVNNSFAVKGVRPGSLRPVIYGMMFDLKTGTALELKDLVCNGTVTSTSADYMFTFVDAGQNGELKVTNSDIISYGSGFINHRKETQTEAMTITGCYFEGIGGRFFDIQHGYAKVIDFKRNTVTNCINSNDAFRIDNSAETFDGVSSIITLENNTFYNVVNGSSRRLLYVRLSGNEIHFVRNIVAGTEGYFSNQASTNVAEFLSNYYFGADKFMDTEQVVHDASGTVADPGFVDAENGDFTVTNTAFMDANVGDPRWLN
ncbi:MAG: DUF5123 domain-containing protein [Culturomica sp.]|nr:DUF5123 domain-containing protein [Culturomica sp.]